MCAIWLRQKKSDNVEFLAWNVCYRGHAAIFEYVVWQIPRIPSKMRCSSFACNKNSHSKKPIVKNKVSFILAAQPLSLFKTVYSKTYRMPLHWTINKWNVAKNSFEKSISILFDWKIARSQKKNKTNHWVNIQKVKFINESTNRTMAIKQTCFEIVNFSWIDWIEYTLKTLHDSFQKRDSIVGLCHQSITRTP